MSSLISTHEAQVVRLPRLQVTDRTCDTPSDQKGRVLVVDDEAGARIALAELLRDEGYATETAADGLQALALLEAFDPDVVLTDLTMPGLDGLGLVQQGRALLPHTAFLVMTAFGSIATAVEAIQRGAENYLTKPLDLDTVCALVLRACEKARLSREANDLRERVANRLQRGDILGEHPSMQRLLKMIPQVGPSRATVLIFGESGTGKELIAMAIHEHSARAHRPFVRLNCAVLVESLLESELFGHEAGAFTGALTRVEGRFKQADGGTLFLDDVSEIPMATQVKLLRFLQEKQFERVGGNETLSADVRIIAATNRDLRDKVKAGTFREDLLYRLNVVQLNLPPLRLRRSDIPLLAQFFLQRTAAENARELRGFTDEAVHKMLNYAWPGNVRELENAVERSVVLCTDDLVGPEHLPGEPVTTDRSSLDLPLLIPGITLAELEKLAILQVLESVAGNTAKAAELLGVSRRKVQYRLKEWGMVEGSDSDASEPSLPPRARAFSGTDLGIRTRR